jgi:hypothetical protein
MIEELKHQRLMTIHLDVAYDQALQLGATPAGTRGIYPVRGGRFEGERLRGTVMPGADWILWRPDEAMIIDVRLSLLTDDGAHIAMPYVGLSYGKTEAARAAARKREIVGYDDVYIRTTPRFETSDPRYEWLNRVIAVANGFRTPEGPRYELFEIL